MLVERPQSPNCRCMRALWEPGNIAQLDAAAETLCAMVMPLCRMGTPAGAMHPCWAPPSGWPVPPLAADMTPYSTLATRPAPDRLVVRTSRCGRGNPGSNPGEDSRMVGFFAPGAEVACREYHRPRNLTDNGSIPGVGATAPDECGGVGDGRRRQCGSPWCVGGTAPLLVTHSARHSPEPLGGSAQWRRGRGPLCCATHDLAGWPMHHVLII